MFLLVDPLEEGGPLALSFAWYFPLSTMLGDFDRLFEASLWSLLLRPFLDVGCLGDLFEGVLGLHSLMVCKWG